MAGPGRDPAIDPKVQKAICTAIAKGTPRKYAAINNGIGERTLRLWCEKGKKKTKPIYTAFLAALEKAKAKCISDKIAVIHKAAEGVKSTSIKTTVSANGDTKTETTTKKEFDWCAAAWMLERMAPDDFALQRKKDIQEAVAVALEKAMKNGLLKSGNSSGDSKPGEEDGKPKKPTPKGRDPRSV